MQSWLGRGGEGRGGEGRGGEGRGGEGRGGEGRGISVMHIKNEKIFSVVHLSFSGTCRANKPIQLLGVVPFFNLGPSKTPDAIMEDGNGNAEIIYDSTWRNAWNPERDWSVSNRMPPQVGGVPADPEHCYFALLHCTKAQR